MATPTTLRDFVAGPWKTACYDRCKPSTRKCMDSALRTQLLPAFGAWPLHRIRPAAVHRKSEIGAGLAAALAGAGTDGADARDASSGLT